MLKFFVQEARLNRMHTLPLDSIGFCFGIGMFRSASKSVPVGIADQV